MKKLLVVVATLPLVAAGWLAPASAAKPTPSKATLVAKPAPRSAGSFATRSARTGSTISWQGYDWVPRTVSGNPGAPQQWSASNVWVDAAGRLHLRTTRDKKGRYTQAELDSARNGWGYGTYRWQIDTDVTTLAPEDVLGLFTYGQDAAYGHREMDIEASGWGGTPITWDYTTWADGHDAVARTTAPSGPSTQQIDWEPGRITWTSWDALGNVIATATATGANVPVPYDESIGINLWICGCESGWQNTPATEVVLSGFSFIPATA